MNLFRPDLPRPIKVNLALPITFCIFCVILVLLPSLKDPLLLLYGILITASGIPVYYVGLKWKNKPKGIAHMSKRLERFCQIMFNTVFIDTEKEV